MSVITQPTRIPLQRMRHLLEASSADDDWTGMASAEARRKRQNRLNVRAHRRRKARVDKALRPGTSVAGVDELLAPFWVENQQEVVWMLRSTAASADHRNLPLLPMIGKTAEEIQKVIFPLSPDHLIILLQYGVLRGSLTNQGLLSEMLIDSGGDANGPENFHVCVLRDDFKTGRGPRSLYPTALQQAIAHPNWIDIIPHPRLRDNLIRALGVFDADELWTDSVGHLFQALPASEEYQGAIVWSTPWHFSGWELTEEFVQKWKWALADCDGLLVATNFWRAKRGEEPLSFDM